MQPIIDRYRGQKTGKTGADIRVDERDGGVTIWYLEWTDEDDYLHTGIARVSKRDGSYSIGWLRGEDRFPYRTDIFSTEQAALDALDKEISQR